MSSHRVSIVFYVDGNNTFTGVPNKKPFPNTYDYLGQLVGLPRLPNEKNPSYRDRILDVKVNPAGPTYNGLVNGIYRELGLSKFDAFSVSPVYASATETVARSPVVEIKATKVVLYEAWWGTEDYVIDREIDFYNRSDPGYFLGDLVSLINESPYFSALLVHSDSFMPSQFLLRDRTTKLVLDEVIPAGLRYRLKNSDLIDSTLRIRDSFSTYEISSHRDISSSNASNVLTFMFSVTENLTERGQFTLDRYNGILEFTSLPTGVGTAQYMYFDWPWTFKASDVAVFGLGEEDFWENMFEKKLDRFGEEYLGLPTVEGTDYLQELFRSAKVFWGR